MIWIIGTGNIGTVYAKILNELKVDYIAIGRGESSALKFQEATGHKVITGGLEQFLASNPVLPDKAIVTVRTKDLAKVEIELIKYGVKVMLCEKPGYYRPSELEELEAVVKEHDAKLYIAYNRRFYASTMKAEEIIKEDGGVTSFNFEFTEWVRLFEKRVGDYPETLFYANSSHVVDLAFFLGGFPQEMSCYTADRIPWHNPAIYAGAGVSDKGALFSYQANWKAPGRWVVEVLTRKHRLYFKPMETLQIQQMDTVKVEPVEIDDSLDKQFKPGFYLETKAFLNDDYTRFCTFEQQVEHVRNFYMKMGKPAEE